MSTPITKRFYQDPDGRWYIDLPEFIESGLGTKANLEMVAGADTLLSQLAEGQKEVNIRFNNQEFPEAEIHLIKSSQHGYDLDLEPDEDPGGWYHDKHTKESLWLCPVTLYVFNSVYPDNIYIQKV